MSETDFFTALSAALPTGSASFTTHAPAETEELGAALARLMEVDTSLPPFMAMYGDLGVGKTAFVRGLASVLAPGRAVRSPTFALVNEYRAAGRRPLFHFDLYRIDSEEDLYSMGFDDYLDAGICVAEWCEKIPYALPTRRLEVRIAKSPLDVDRREITISMFAHSSKEVCLC